MIQIIYKGNGKYAFKGNIDLGVLGQFKNDMVEIEFSMHDLYDDRHDYMVDQYKPLREYVKKDMDEKEVAEGLTAFYSKKIEDIREHLNDIVERYLINVFDDMIDADFEFWEDNNGYSRFIIPENMPDIPADDLEGTIYTMEGFDEFSRLYEKETGYDIGEVPVREYVNKYFPMIDYDKLVGGIYPQYVNFEGNYFSIQCDSEDCDYGIVCSACATYIGDYTIDEWHNF